MKGCRAVGGLVEGDSDDFDVLYAHTVGLLLPGVLDHPTTRTTGVRRMMCVSNTTLHLRPYFYTTYISLPITVVIKTRHNTSIEANGLNATKHPSNCCWLPSYGNRSKCPAGVAVSAGWWSPNWIGLSLGDLAWKYGGSRWPSQYKVEFPSRLLFRILHNLVIPNMKRWVDKRTAPSSCSQPDAARHSRQHFFGCYYIYHIVPELNCIMVIPHYTSTKSFP
ncbi:hypothetical protein EDB81DRAFT_455064 [Dactylonectria macrodidyma]|uniref:Uncharacterized protein n=1 Tax=Dactylonectria macrodidyma TaxID=307937 RepID=A0A9P9F603_9HYPO|nr:hypothetical protein EDB81DRAFT_455064 [Dactylonectria macrodidyma]